MKIYRGQRLEPEAGTAGETLVTVTDGNITKELDPKPSQKVHNHSPDGFNWGYGGSGPAQLALGILLDHLNGDEERAHRLYQTFKFRVIARLEQDADWELTSEQIDAEISEIEAEAKQSA